MYFAYYETQAIRVNVITLSTVNSEQLAAGIFTVSVRVLRAPFSFVSVIVFFSFFPYNNVCV